jgi:glycerophosphoryl diester phosphodiesterase
MAVLAYGVNTRRQLHRAVRLGVNGVITDVPRIIRSLVTHL